MPARSLTMLTLVMILGTSTPGAAADFFGRILYVYSGDRMEIAHEGRREHIRLYGIVCAGGPYADQALQFTRNMAGARGVHVLTVGNDAHGSQWVDVRFLGGESLSHELLRSGLARWDRDQAPEDATLAMLESEARKARRGIWAETTDDSRPNAKVRKKRAPRNMISPSRPDPSSAHLALPSKPKSLS